MLKRVKTGNSNIDRIQDNVDSALIPIQLSPLIGGNVVTGQVLTIGANNLVQHGLQRVPSYFVVLSQNAGVSIWTESLATLLLNGQASNANDQYINLKTSATVTATIWFN